MNGASDNAISAIGLGQYPVSVAGVHSSTFLTSTLTRNVFLPPIIHKATLTKDCAGRDRFSIKPERHL